MTAAFVQPFRADPTDPALLAEREASGYLSVRGNWARTSWFRNDVILHLHDCGFSSAARRGEPKGLSPSQREANDLGDILGLPWTLSVRCEQETDLSGTMAKAARAAANAGSELYAAVHVRKNYPTEESYVTMPLSVFTRVLAMTPSLPSDSAGPGGG